MVTPGATAAQCGAKTRPPPGRPAAAGARPRTARDRTHRSPNGRARKSTWPSPRRPNYSGPTTDSSQCRIRSD